MSNSSLISYTRISPNHSSRNGRRITKITPHHCAGVMSAERIANFFANPSAGCSANYGIGNDGQISLCVDESDRAWTSGNYDNDSIAVTIEVSNESGAPEWRVSDAALSSLVKLCVDICKRNGITQLNFTGDKSGNLTMHKMFMNTLCPGPYLESKFPWLAEQVNNALRNENSKPEPDPEPVPVDGKVYIVQKNDTMWGIARKFNTSVNQLVKINGLKNASLIYPGQRLYVNSESKSEDENQTNSNDKIYIVQKGDTLWGIARKNKTNVAKLKKANNLSNASLIFPGQKLIIE